MLGLFKRNDGFEWKKHIRTTIRLRRDDRKKKLQAAKGAVVKGVHGAGAASVSVGGTIAQRTWNALTGGIRGLGRGCVAGAAALVWGMSAVATALSAGAGRLAGAASPILSRTGEFLSRRPVRMAAALVAGAASIWALSRYRAQGLDTEVAVVAAAALISSAIVLVPLVLPRVVAAVRPLAAGLRAASAKIGVSQTAVRFGAVAVVGGGVAAAGYALVAPAAGPMFASLPSLPRLAMLGPPEISGRAIAVSGDTLRLDGRLIGLAGIEAPASGQRCLRPGRPSWRCGIAATEALARMLRRDVVVCLPTGSEERGRQLAKCRVAGEDLAGQLVRDGAVFASAGYFSTYASLETSAKAQKAGVWSGDAERPEAWRSRLLEEAKKRAPNRCPVKGVKVAGGLRYVMPWESDYSRVRVRASRGERWFCTEDEARTAGYRLAS